jgi:hypothetical protein
MKGNIYGIYLHAFHSKRGRKEKSIKISTAEAQKK